MRHHEEEKMHQKQKDPSHYKKFFKRAFVRSNLWVMLVISLMSFPLFFYQACSGGFEVKSGLVEASSSTVTPPVVVPDVSPTIMQQPSSLTVNQGASAQFSVQASGTGSLQYQWLKNGSSIAGGSQATLVLTNVAASASGSYSVLVINSVGQVTSLPATLNVLTPPVIIQQPLSQTANQGGSASLSVAASGSAVLNYQWNKNGAPIVGASNSTLNLSNLKSTDAGNYTVTVSNAVSTVTSTAATLTVNPTMVTGTPPSITTQPLGQTVNVGQDVSFSVTASGTAPFSYQWRFNGVDISGLTAQSSQFIGVTPSQTGSYQVLVSNSAGSVVSTAAVLTVLSPPTISQQPIPQIITEGASVSFSVVASGSGTLNYQWMFNSVSIAGATSSTLSMTNVLAAQAGSYSVRIQNALGSIVSNSATLNVIVLPKIATQPVSQSVGLGQLVSFSVVASGAGPFYYQWQLNGVNIALNKVSSAESAQLDLIFVQTSQAGVYTVIVRNPSGQIVSSSATLTVIPPPNTKALAIFAGEESNCALTLQGGLKCWGGNLDGELGNNTRLPSSIPNDVLSLGGNVTMGSIQGENGCALMQSGTVKCWGYNGWGAVGNNSTVDILLPTDVVGLTGAVSVQVGGFQVCALTNTGTVSCWGYNGSRQLASNSISQSNVPLAIGGVSGTTALAAGFEHNCILTSQSTVKCWGDNSVGELGSNDSFSVSPTPVDVVGLSGITAISSNAAASTCALTSAGNVKCWGQNNYGQLGNNSKVDSRVPVDVAGLSNVTAISAGQTHTCAIIRGGTVKCWGLNSDGALGSGTNIDSLVPVDVVGLSGVTSISAGYNHTCALTSIGAVKCWGVNSYYDLGDNTNIESNVPVDVVGLNGG